jgi:DNA-3-methyladenine glycosylase
MDCFPGEFFRSSATEVARGLLGWELVSDLGGLRTSGRIVETEAYLGPEDPASHAATRAGRTHRNAPMFGPGGSAYVYFIYGMHWCFNVVTGSPGDPQAVLIRALDPTDGLEIMAQRRGGPRNLANGPARLCQALGITGHLNEHPLDRSPLRLLPGSPVADDRVRTSGRIGIRRAKDWPLRYFMAHHPQVSVTRTPS